MIRNKSPGGVSFTSKHSTRILVSLILVVTRKTQMICHKSSQQTRHLAMTVYVQFILVRHNDSVGKDNIPKMKGVATGKSPPHLNRRMH